MPHHRVGPQAAARADTTGVRSWCTTRGWWRATAGRRRKRGDPSTMDDTTTAVPAMTRPGPAPLVPLHLPAAAWEDVLDALGVAAEWTSDDIDCATCASATPCDLHDGDWARVDRWRELATQLREQLTTTPQPSKEHR